MKKRLWGIVLCAIALVLSVSAFIACGEQTKPPVDDKNADAENCKIVEIVVNSEHVTLLEENAVGYDYTVFFTIYGDGKKCTVKKEYVDSSAVKAEVGTYKVYCSVKGEKAEITVHVNSSAPVSVTALVEKVELKDDEIAGYDFASLFRVSVSGETVEITNADLDLSGLKTQRGTYIVSCTYKGKKAEVAVVVTEVTYTARVACESITINVSQTEDYDFASYFIVKRDGVKYKVENSMLSGEVKAAAGSYTLTFSRGKASASLKVNVTTADVYETGKAYESIQLPLADALVRDFSKDFYIYKNGKAEKTETSAINASAVKNAKIGDKIKVTCTLPDGKSESVTVEIIKDDVTIITKAAEVFVNGETVDLASLFSLSRGGEEIEVTYDMISGEPDYSKAGEYTVTLNYEGRTASAKITVKTGVIVDYAKGETVIIKKGTSKQTYDFAADFSVKINGVKFSDLSSYISGIDQADFNVKGEYAVTLTLDYNDQSISLGGVKFTHPSKTIIYKVVDNDYSVSVKEKQIEVKKGETFNPLSNVTVYLNGIKQTLTSDKTAANGYTSTYACLAGDIDLSVGGKQTVTVKVYVNGPESEDYATISYDVLVNTNIEISAENKVIFTGDTLYTPDLFTVVDDNEIQKISLDMISGSFDPFTAGAYTLTLEYKDTLKTAYVTVLDRGIIGTYKTSQYTIGSDSQYDDEGQIYEEGVKSEKIKDLVIPADLKVVFREKQVQNLRSDGVNAFKFNIDRTVYNLVYSDGVALVTYDNSLRMKLTNNTMPVVYFNQALWTITDTFTINSSKNNNHVLTLDYDNYYSIDLFKVKSAGGEEKWFGLKNKLHKVSSTYSPDYYYDISFGEAIFAEGFVKTSGVSSSVTLNGEKYAFNVVNENSAIIDSSSSGASYYGTYSGKVNGANATLSITTSHIVTFTAGGTVEAKLYSTDISALGYVPSNFEEGTYSIHGAKVVTLDKSSNRTSVSFTSDLRSALSYVKDTSDEKVTVYPYSYKFAINEADKTFTLLEKDRFFGLYKNADGSQFVMLGGYGAGVVSFDTSSYETVSFDYSSRGNTALITYKKSDISYGNGMALALNADENSVTVLSSGGKIAAGAAFESACIVDGAVVRIKSYIAKKGTSNDEYLKNITIITANGEMTAAERKNAVTLNTVRFSTVGFYQFYITVKSGGVSKNLYYGVQVIDKKYTGSPFVGNFTKSFGGENTLKIDEYGYITFVSGGVSYEGIAVIGGDELSATVYSDAGKSYELSAKFENENILYVEAKGENNVVDYFAVNDTAFAGNGEVVLREIKTSSGYDYYASASKLVLGEKVTVSFINGTTLKNNAEIKITYKNGKSLTVKIVAAGDDKAGLTVI